MIRIRTQDLPDLDATYSRLYDHRLWPDHRVRVDMTIGFTKWYAQMPHVQSVADLSCGDAAIIDALDIPRKIRGDFVQGYQFQGPIEDTIDLIDPVDLFICSETLEHLDDPDLVLTKIRQKTDYLVVTTPNTPMGDSNPEHVWAWDTEAVKEMLENAGFKTEMNTILQFPSGYYTFQFWGCS